jgi:hypothetical protein
MHTVARLKRFRVNLTTRSTSSEGTIPGNSGDFTDTAEALAEAYLKATTEKQRAELLVQSEPITHGFTKGLLDEGQNLLEARGDDVNAAAFCDFRIGILFYELSKLALRIIDQTCARICYAESEV